MQLTVRSRRPPLPWEQVGIPPRVRVGLEAHVRPDAGALRRYHAVFPERTVRWNASRQLFEIRQQNPRTGREERVRFVMQYVEAPGGGWVPAFQPFDHQYVTDALARAHEFRVGAEGDVKRHLGLVDRRNAALERSRLRDFTRESAAAIGEVRRWLPTISGDEPIPLVPGGISR